MSVKTLSFSTLAVLLSTQWAEATDLLPVTAKDHILNVQDQCIGQWFSDECEQAIAISNSMMTYDYLKVLFNNGFDSAALHATSACSPNLDDWKRDIMTGDKISPFPVSCDQSITFWGAATGVYPNEIQRLIMRNTNNLTDGEEETSTHSLMQSTFEEFSFINR